jgi:hypothetical protein
MTTYTGQREQKKKTDVLGEVTPKKLATAMQLKIPRNVIEFKQSSESKLRKFSMLLEYNNN